MKPPRLTTARLVLREFTEGDLDQLVELDSDPEVVRFINGGVPIPREQAAETLRRLMARTVGDGFGYWAAEVYGSFIGWFHFRTDVYLPTATEVGYRLRQDAWGMGYATEGTRGLIEDGVQNLGVSHVTGRTMKGNRGSARVLEKCGLELVGEYEESRWPGEDKTALLFERRY